MPDWRIQISGAGCAPEATWQEVPCADIEDFSLHASKRSAAERRAAAATVPSPPRPLLVDERAALRGKRNATDDKAH
jgi:hypothetical protein